MTASKAPIATSFATLSVAERMKPGRNPWLPDFVKRLQEEKG